MTSIRCMDDRCGDCDVCRLRAEVQSLRAQLAAARAEVERLKDCHSETPCGACTTCWAKVHATVEADLDQARADLASARAERDQARAETQALDCDMGCGCGQHHCEEGHPCVVKQRDDAREDRDALLKAARDLGLEVTYHGESGRSFGCRNARADALAVQYREARDLLRRARLWVVAAGLDTEWVEPPEWVTLADTMGLEAQGQPAPAPGPHPDGCWKEPGPQVFRDCTSDGHYACKSCGCLDAPEPKPPDYGGTAEWARDLLEPAPAPQADPWALLEAVVTAGEDINPDERQHRIQLAWSTARAALEARKEAR